MKYWKCSVCGFSEDNRANWCASGCGRDYQKMIEIEEPPFHKHQREERYDKFVTRLAGSTDEDSGHMEVFTPEGALNYLKLEGGLE